MSKFLSLVSGRIKEVVAIVSSIGTSDAGKIIATDASGRIDQSFMPVGIGAETKAILASENISGGDLVNIWSNSGVVSIRKADASTSGKEANGFVLDAVASGTIGSVYLEGSITGLSGLVVGRYYLSDTFPGGMTATPVVGAGKVHQYIGVAHSASELSFEADDAIILA